MSNKTFTSESILSSGEEQSSMPNAKKINSDTEINDFRSNSKKCSSGSPDVIVETISPSISSTTNTNKSNQGHKTKTNSNYKNQSPNQLFTQVKRNGLRLRAVFGQ
ncbi:unnamed protein product [Rotaria socialis]|uniref:Uncharacterized protein n=1 Tax=Rotaria socialis TaxID=392032 RepID=A0A818Q001_9BILA|nr:unnamed protein product [Rotaria socialis]CAF4931691.1 unnamed protein product [Rotaria socialis]